MHCVICSVLPSPGDDMTLTPSEVAKQINSETKILCILKTIKPLSFLVLEHRYEEGKKCIQRLPSATPDANWNLHLWSYTEPLVCTLFQYFWGQLCPSGTLNTARNDPLAQSGQTGPQANV